MSRPSSSPSANGRPSVTRAIIVNFTIVISWAHTCKIIKAISNRKILMQIPEDKRLMSIPTMIVRTWMWVLAVTSDNNATNNHLLRLLWFPSMNRNKLNPIYALQEICYIRYRKMLENYPLIMNFIIPETLKSS